MEILEAHPDLQQQPLRIFALFSIYIFRNSMLEAEPESDFSK